MVHHSIAVVITSFLTYFVERRKAEVRRIKKGRIPVALDPSYNLSTFDSGVSSHS